MVKKHSEDSLAKKYKAVLQLDIHNKYIQEYKSIKEAADTVGISKNSSSGCSKGQV